MLGLAEADCGSGFGERRWGFWVFFFQKRAGVGICGNGFWQLAVVLDGYVDGGWQWMIGRLDYGMDMGRMDRLRLVTGG